MSTLIAYISLSTLITFVKAISSYFHFYSNVDLNSLHFTVDFNNFCERYFVIFSFLFYVDLSDEKFAIDFVNPKERMQMKLNKCENEIFLFYLRSPPGCFHRAQNLQNG